MKSLIIITALLFCVTLYAGVNKCKNTNGKTVYQSRPCPKEDKSTEVDIKHFSQDRIDAAQKKLNDYTIEQHRLQEAEIEAQEKYRQEQLRLMEIQAQREQARAQHNQVRATDRQSRAIILNGYLRK